MFIEPLGPLRCDGFGQEGSAGPGLGSGFGLWVLAMKAYLGESEASRRA